MWFERAARQGYAKAQYTFGLLNRQGFGIEKNIDLAVHWFRRAALQNYGRAQYALGRALLLDENDDTFGEGQRLRAAAWLFIAAETGYERAVAAFRKLYRTLNEKDRQQVLILARDLQGQIREAA